MEIVKILLYLEMTEVVPVHCNIVNKDYQCNSKNLYTLVPDKSSGQLFDILPKNISVIQRFFILKYDLLIKILNCLWQKI